jgi:hypothetical protein
MWGAQKKFGAGNMYSKNKAFCIFQCMQLIQLKNCLAVTNGFLKG